MIEENKREKARVLFAGRGDKMVESALSGMMGRVFTKVEEETRCAAVLMGDFLFVSGTGDPAFLQELCSSLDHDFLILKATLGEWEGAVKTVLPEAREHIRYRMCTGRFDRSVLKSFAEQLPPGYALKPMEAGWYERLMGEDWSRDFCSLFRDGADFAHRGLGVLAVQDGVPVAGASSYAVYPKGIEVELDTKPAYRRKGLARAAAAGLILRCLDRGWEPHWDADNSVSAHIAEQLGYLPAGAYRVWKWSRDQSRFEQKNG